MNIIIDKNGNLSFDEYFKESDAEMIRTFLEEKLGIFAKIERHPEREFKQIPALWKKRVIRDIDWSDPRNIIILLKNEDKNNDDILVLLGVPNRESSFVVVTRMRQVRQEFKSWTKELGLDDSLEEHIERFAKIYAFKQKKNNQIIKEIEEMVEERCKILEDKENKLPECEEKFSLNCIKCQFNKKHILDETNIERFNEVLDKNFEEEK